VLADRTNGDDGFTRKVKGRVRFCRDWERGRESEGFVRVKVCESVCGESESFKQSE